MENISCPVCNESISKKIVRDAEDKIVEQIRKCGKCGYSFDFSFGSYKEMVNGYEFSWNETDIENEKAFCEFRNFVDENVSRNRFKWKFFRIKYIDTPPKAYYVFCNNVHDNVKGKCWKKYKSEYDFMPLFK